MKHVFDEFDSYLLWLRNLELFHTKRIRGGGELRVGTTKFQIGKSVLGHILVKTNENFRNKHLQRLKPCNNCFGIKQHNSIIPQTKISSRDYAKIITTLKTE